MKKALLTLAALAMAGSAYAQGTIKFETGDIPNATGGGTYNAFIFMPGGTTPANSSINAALFKADGTLVPGSQTAVLGNFGVVIGPEVAVPTAAPNSTAQLFVRAWANSFASFDAAAAANGLRGQSATFTSQPLGGTNPNPPPPSFFTPGMTGLQSFTLVPEPSTYALGVAGLGALALMRRRK